MPSNSNREEMGLCAIRNVEYPISEMEYVNGSDCYVHSDEYADATSQCDDCGDMFLNHHLNDSHEICELCQENRDESEDEDDDEFRYRDTDMSAKKYISEDTGKIIKSTRTFGVELEVQNDDNEALVKATHEIPREYGIVHDGSISGQGIEVVSPILAGKAGEESIKQVCSVLNKHDFTVDNSCGYHVHIGASDFTQKKQYEIMISASYESLVRDYARSLQGSEKASIPFVATKRLIDTFRFVSSKNRHRILSKALLSFERLLGNCIDGNSMSESSTLFAEDTSESGTRTGAYCPEVELEGGQKKHGVFLLKSMPVGANRNDGFYYLVDFVPTDSGIASEPSSLLQLKRGFEAEAKSPAEHPFSSAFATHAMTLWEQTNDESTSKLRNLLYVYTLFSNVMLAMLPASRKNNTRYCRSMISGFSLSDIANAERYSDIESLWYKTTKKYEIESRKRGKYDSSRYHGLNLHILFVKGKTAEVRYHSGTTNALKVLMWANMHLTIFDAVANRKLPSNILSMTPSPRLQDDIQLFFKVFKFNKQTQEYIKDRIKHFSGIDTSRMKREWPEE